MSNWIDLGIADAPFTADADLTGKQYYFVTVASTVGNVKTATGASNPTPVGVLQDSPSAGQGARVRALGFTKVVGRVATCNLSWGKYIVCASDGAAECPATGTGSPVMGRWYGESITSGSIYGQAYIFGAGISPCNASAS